MVYASKMKIIKTTVTLILFVIVSTLAIVFTLDEEDYSEGLIWAIHAFSDYQIETIDITSMELSSTSTLIAKNIKAQTQAGNQKITADLIEIQFSLMSVFSERFDIEKLIVRDSKIIISNLASSLTIDSEDLLIPTIEHAQLFNVNVLCECQGSEPLDLYLENISIFDNKEGEVTISGVGEFEQSPFELTGNLGSVSQLNKHEQLFPINLAFQLPNFSFVIQGSLGESLELEGFDLKFTGDVTELSVIAQHFFVGLPALGKAHLDFGLKGDWDNLHITDLNATLVNKSTIDISLKGDIDDVLGDFETELYVNGSVRNPELIERLFVPIAPITFTNIELDGLVTFNQYAGLIKKMNLQLVDEQDFKVNAGGTGQFNIDSDYRFSDVELDVDIAATSASTMAFQPLIGKQIPELGNVFAKTSLVLASNELSLSDINIIIGRKQQLKITVSGKSDEFVVGSNIEHVALDLNIELSGQNIEHINFLKDNVNNIAGIDALTAKLNLSGSLNKSELNVENISVHHVDGITLQSHGKVQFGDIRQAEPIKALSLQLDSQLVKMETLAPWIDTTLPPLGELKLSTNIQGQGTHFSLQDLQVNIGDKSSVWMMLEGGVKDLYYDDGLIWSGLLMGAEFLTWDSHQLARYLDMTLPDIEKAYGQYKISGNSTSLTVTDLNFTVLNHSGLHLLGTGSIGTTGLLSNSTLSDVDISLIAEADSNTSLASIINQDLPDFGSVNVTARLIDRHRALGLEDIVLTIKGADEKIITATGQILNILDEHKLNLNAQFETEASVLLEHILDQQIPDIGTLTGHITVSNHDGSLGIESLVLSSIDTELYQLAAKGVFDNYQMGDELKLDIELEIDKPILLGEKLGIEVADLEAIRFVGFIEGSNERSIVKGDIDIGSTHFGSDVIVSYIDDYPIVKGTLFTQQLDLKDIAIHHEKYTPNVVNGENKRLFSSELLPFDAIKNIGLDLHISADEIVGTKFNIDTAIVHVEASEDVLTINSANLVFDGGFISMDASISTDTERPHINLEIQADDVDVGQVASQLIENHVLEGDLTMHMNLSGTGHSLAEIAASLDGDIAVALDNGVLHEASLALLNIDFLAWFFDHLVQKEQTGIHCAMSHHQIKRGIADLKMLIVTTPDLEANGDGNINLKNETIDLTLYTDNKRIFKPKTPISVKGDLRSPAVTILPSINTLTSMAFSVVPELILADVVLSKFWNLLQEGDVDSKCEGFLP